MPACDRVNDRNTPIAYRGIRAVTLARKTAIRMQATSASSMMPREYTRRLPRKANCRGRNLSSAIKALNLVVQSRVCTLVVIDLVDVPAAALCRLPSATWFRIERAIEGSDTAVLIVAAQSVARSSGGRSIVLGEPPASSAASSKECRPRHVSWKGDHDRSRRLSGVRLRASISAARWAHVHTVDAETILANTV